MMSDVIRLAGRVLLAAIFLVSGTGKITAAAHYAPFFASVGLPVPLAMTYLVGLCEIVGGAAMVLGVRTRMVAPLLAAFCVATALLAHMGQETQFLKNLSMAGGFLMVVAAGPGRFAIDRRH